MLKKIMSAAFLMLIALSAAATEPIMVDTRLLLLAHPLFKSFDHETRRFKNTSSEFVAGGQQGVDELIAEIKKLNNWLLNSPKHLQEKLKQVPLPDRIGAERAFLAEKREIENRLATLQLRAYNARLVPGRPGVTPESSIMPQINEINSDIRAVVEQLKQKFKTETVIDSAELLPIASREQAKSALLGENLHSSLWKKTKTADDKDLAAWFDLADDYWARRLGLDADVFPVGAQDVRLEAVKLMEEHTKGLKK